MASVAQTLPMISETKPPIPIEPGSSTTATQMIAEVEEATGKPVYVFPDSLY